MTMPAHSEQPDPRLGIGGNNPPEQTLIERLAESHRDVGVLIDKIADQANKLPKIIEDDEQLKAVAEVGARAAAEWANTDTTRKREKDPFLKGQREVDGFFRDWLDRLDRIKRALQQRADIYRDQQEEKARRQREAEAEAARAALEASQKAAAEAEAAGRIEDAQAEYDDAAKAEQVLAQVEAAPAAAPVRTDSGVRVGGQKTWTFEIEDYDAIPVAVLKPWLDREAVEKALRALVKVQKGNAKVAGVRFFQKSSTQFRRG